MKKKKTIFFKCIFSFSRYQKLKKLKRIRNKRNKDRPLEDYNYPLW